MASNWPPKKNVAFTMYFFIHKSDGTIIANPTLTGSNVHVDGNVTQVTDSTLAVVDAVTGLCSIVLAQATMNGDQIDGTITASDSGAVVYTFKLMTAANTQDEIVAGTVKAKVEVAALTANIITEAAIADDAFTAAQFADDCLVAANLGTGCLTADAFAADAIVAATLATGAITADAFAADAIVAATLATGALTADAFAADALVAATFATSCITDDALDSTVVDGISTAVVTDIPATLAAFATTADIATEVIDHDLTGHTTADTIGGVMNGLATDAEIATAVGTELGTGTAFTAIPWNASWDSEVQSECTDSLNAYDPPTKAELDSGFAALASDTEVGAACWADADGVLVKAAVYTNAAGTDIAADIIALKAETVSILEDTGTTIPATLAAFATTADIADAVLDEAVGAHTGAIAEILADTGTDGVVLKAAGLNNDAVVEIATGILDQALATGDADALDARTVRSALRLLRNYAGVSGGILTVKKENDTDTAWTAAVTTDAGASPIVTINPT